MADPIEITVGDTGVKLAGTLSAADDSLPDLIGATVKVSIRKQNQIGGTPAVDLATCTVDNATAAAVGAIPARHVYYQFVAGDFANLVAGQMYTVQFKVTRADNKVVHVPNTRRYYTLLWVNPTVGST
jgi:hypothetical protein